MKGIAFLIKSVLTSIVLVFVLFSLKVQGQTVLISPTGVGGFESGTTFAANGWTVVNAASNIWEVGTAATAYAGSRGVYVANPTGTYAYTTSTSRTSHFYRDVAIPSGATSITLSFYWKGKGESSYDRALVYTAPTTVTPVSGTPASSSTTLTGATLVWTQPTYTNSSTYTLATVTLPNTLAGTTVRLIFTWQNDASGGTSPGAAIDNISLVYNPPCSSTPVPGNTIASINPVCSGVNFTLTPASLEGGQNYQWQSSTDGVTYSNVGGNVASYTVNQSTATYYQCMVTCTASGSTATSTPVYVTMNSPANCYCTSNATTTSDEDILNVTFGTLSNTSTCSTTGGSGSVLNEYSNYTGVAAPSVQQGSSVAFSIQVGTCGSNYSNACAIWIDFNNDGDFNDAGEKVYAATATTSGPHTESGTITIPIFANVGLTRMRVICQESSVPTSPCGTYSYGETEDYMINITAAPACTGTPNAGTATASIASGCGNTPVTLSATGLTAATGISYQWQSSSSATGPWTDIPGALNLSTYTTTAYSTTYYQLVSTCSNSGLSNTTNVVNYNVIPSGCCQVTLSLYDDGADGWGTSNIKVYAGTTLIGTYTLASGSGPGTYNFSTNSTDSITIVFTGSGSSPTDCYFNVVGPTGNYMVKDYYPALFGTWHGGYACPQVPPVQTPCYNLGFESGLTGWYGTQGNPIEGAPTDATPTYVPQVFGVTIGNNFHLMTAGTDPIAPINKVYAGTYSLKLGNDTTYDIYNAASIEQTFLVTTANTDFSYNYAVVLYDGGHADYEQPFFEADVIDGNGNPITCGLFQVAAPGLGASFIETSTADVYYKPWTTVSVNLTAYIGQNVTVRFKVSDCSQGAHYGYAYIDCTCSAYGIINPAVICSGQSATLTAPSGAAAYLWSPGGQTTSSITVSPTTTTNYTCSITSQGTVPCYFTLNTTVTVNGIGSVTASNDGPICTGAPLNLTSTPAGGTYAWTGPGSFTSTLQNPTIATTTTANNGTYTVVVTFPGGCTASAQTTASVTTSSAASILNNTGSTVLTCTTTSINVTAQGGDTYAWSGGATPATATNSFTTPGTYTVTVSTGGSCISTASITITQSLSPPTATISYTGSPWCTSAGVQSVTLTGTSGGTYTVSPSGLTINSSTGQITPSTSTAGAYTVTYTTPAIGSCAAVTAAASVTVNAVDNPAFNYSPTTMCQTGTDQSANITGGATGTFTATPSGLVFLNSSTGQIDVSASALNSYTITFTTNGVCPATSTFPITVTSAPVATFNYAGPYCTNGIDPSPTFGVGASAGGFSATPSGLVFVSTSTGQIDASASAAGTYTVTNNIAAAGGCAAASATNSVTITALPTATIAYTGSPWCSSAGTQAVTLTGTNGYTGGTYTVSPSGLSIDGSTGLITPSTSTAGIYTVTYTIPALGGCPAVTATTSVTITALPTATISYTGSPWCMTAGTQTVALTGTNAYSGGVYTVSPAGLTINSSSGLITPSSSTAGNYTVTYTVPASGGCAAVPATTNVTITALPTATISYTGAPWCTTAGTQSVTLTGTNAYTSGAYTVLPSGLTVNGSTGLITPNTSTQGSYTVTYTIPASGGCAAVVATTPASITAPPTVTLSYTSSPWCTSAASQTATLTGTNAYTGGAYTVVPSGLSINASTGQITPSTSTAGNYTVTYTTPATSGCALATSNASVTVTALPTATISYTGSPWCTSATNQSVTLTGTNAYTGGAYTVAPSGLSINASTGQITPSTSIAGSYTITYTIPASGGCAAVVATTSGTITALPTAAISYSGSPWCKSVTVQSVSLTGTNAYTGGTYTVAPSGLSINASTGQITPSTSTAGTYTVTYTTLASGGCAQVTATASVTVNALPVATAGSNSPICENETLNLTSGGGTSYSWSGPSSYSNATQNPSITGATSLIAGQYTVTVTGTGNCTSTAQVSVVVNLKPVIHITPSVAQICNGDSTSFTASGATTYTWTPTTALNHTTGATTTATPTATTTYTAHGTTNGCFDSTTIVVTVISNPTIVVTPSTVSICPGEHATLNATGGTTYSWAPATTLSSSTDSTVISTPSGTITYTVTGTTTGCSGTATATVTLKPLPQLSVAPATPAICANNNLTLTATGADSYVWSPDSTLSSSTGSSVIADPLSSCTYHLSGTLNGCTDSIQVPFVVNPLPVITILASPPSGCQPFTTTLSATSVPTAQSYSWTVDGTSYVAPSPTVYFPNSGQYNVSLVITDVNNCANSISETNFITVYPKPTVSFTFTPEEGVVSKPVVFTSSIDAPGSQYIWNFGDGLSTTETSATTTHNYGMTGTLTVTHIYVNEFGCKDTATFPINVVINLVIPNIFTPNGDGQNDTFLIDGLQSVDGAVMKIYNRWGRKIFESNNYKNDWDGGDFADGVYFYILTLPDYIDAGPYNGSVTLLR